LISTRYRYDTGMDQLTIVVWLRTLQGYMKQDDSKKPQRFKECILCGRCLEVCPLFDATGYEELSPRAKAFLVQSFLKHESGFTFEAIRRFSSLCLQCERCVSVCPQGIDLPGILAEVKALSLDWHSWVWGKLIKALPWMYPVLGQWSETIPGMVPEIIRKHIDLFKRCVQIHPWIRIDWEQAPKFDIKAVVFPGCISRCGKRLWETKAESLLQKLGLRLHPRVEWMCCGFTLGMAGLKKEQDKVCHYNLNRWREEGRPSVIIFCETCFYFLQKYIDYDLDWEQGEREEWQQSLIPLSFFLQQLHLTFTEQRPSQGLVLHQSCHSHNNLWEWLLKSKDQLDFPVKSYDACCGLGGSMQLECFEYTRLVGWRFWNYLEHECSQLLSGCSGCVIQLSRYRPEHVSVGHWLEILDL